MILGLEDTLGYNPLRIADYERAVGPGRQCRRSQSAALPGTFRGYRCKLARAARPRLSRARPPAGAHAAAYAAPQCAADLVSDQIYVYKLGRAAPRAYFATRVDGGRFRRRHRRGRHSRFRRNARGARRSGRSAAARSRARRSGARAGGPEAKATIVAYESERILVDVEFGSRRASRPSRSLLSGLGGARGRRPAPIVKANILFRGVPTTKGRHRIEFLFRPFSLANLASAASTLRDHREE